MAELVPVDHDPFASEAKASSGPQLVPVDHDPFAPSQPSSVASDVVKSAGTGLVKGTEGLVGLPGTLAWVADQAAAAPGRTYNKLFGTGKYENTESMNRGVEMAKNNSILNIPKAEEVLSPQNAEKWRKNIIPELHKPETTAGEYAQTFGEFIPAVAAFGSGGPVRRFAQTIIPSTTSETLGQVARKTVPEAEPYARFAGAMAGGLAAGSGAGRGQGIVGREVGKLDAATLDKAEDLFQEAIRQKTPISRAEAIQAASGGATKLGDVQRILEGQGAFKDFYAPRPAQIEASGRQNIETALGPASRQPSQLGPQASEAAGDTVSGVAKMINRAETPYYQAAGTKALGPQEQQSLQLLSSDPAFQKALTSVRSPKGEIRYKDVQHLGNDDVGFLIAVRQELGRMEQAALQRGAGLPADRQLARGITPIQDRLDQIISSAAPEFQQALGVGAALREKYLQPIMQGPIGKIADTPDTKRAIDALFPSNPLANSADEVRDAITSLARTRPQVASQLVRAHVESVFNEATQNLQAGASQFGGATFAATLRGNPQQAENLKAAVTALRGGTAWEGFNKFLTIMEATGQRQRIGSQTAFNQELQAGFKGGRITSEIATQVAGGGIQAPRRIVEALQRWQLDRNVKEMANLLTDPSAAKSFRELANLPTRSAKAQAQAVRLILMGEQISGDTKARTVNVIPKNYAPSAQYQRP